MLGGGSRVALSSVAVVIYAFLLLPIVVVVAASFNAGSYFTFPPSGFSFRWYANFVGSPSFTGPLAFSLELAAIVTVIAATLGTLASLFVVRSGARWVGALRTLVIAPLAAPGILTGLALLIFFYSVGLGTNTGILGLIIGHTVICMPFVFIVVSGVLVGFDRNLEEAARNLGADWLTTFRRVTLPLLRGGLISGAIFAFITSYDEFNVSLLLSGVGTTPLPIQLFNYLQFNFDPTAAVAGTISIVMSVVVVLAIDRVVGLQPVYFGSR